MRERLRPLVQVQIQDRKMAHDLGNHFVMVYGVLRLAKSYIKTKPKRAFELMREAQSEIAFIQEVINRHAQGISISKRPLAFANFVDSIRKSVDAYLRPGGIFFESNLGRNNRRSKIIVDDFALKRTVLNLIENANAAASGKGQIRVAITLNGDELNIMVSDSGKGMREEMVRDFNNGRMFSTKEGAHGFGLVNLKETVVGHGGTVRVQSIIGEGTTFSIEIPCS
jgi:signal transduction histidine kinase